MEHARPLLFYTHSREHGITPLNFSNLEPHHTLAETFHKIAVAIAFTKGESNLPSQADYSVEYDFYDWHLHTLGHGITVREVPPPGIVLAIKKGSLDLDTASMAAIVKLTVESSQDKVQHTLLESFLSSPQGEPEVKISILFLAADPTNASRLRISEELREIQEKLQLAKLRERFDLHQRMAVRPADISQALLDVKPRIVHFSGHGMASGVLCFESQVGEIHPVPPDALAALFEQFANRVHCVVLNACYAETQAKAIAQHVDCVIGMNQAISDRAAIAYAVGFYQALGAGRTIEDAHKLGCVQIRLQGIPEHLTPVLIKKGQMQP